MPFDLFTTLVASALTLAPLKVAVIDTGIDRLDRPELCATGHDDFTGTSITDTHGHGTNVSGLIQQEAKGSNYCQIILKYYKTPIKDNYQPFLNALAKAIDLKVNVINISAGGKEPIAEEFVLIEIALDRGIKIVAAAGNENEDLDKSCNYFPACYDSRIVVVGCKMPDGTKCAESNYGKTVHLYENGYNQTANGITMTGTSQATAITTGKLVKRIAR